MLRNIALALLCLAGMTASAQQAPAAKPHTLNFNTVLHDLEGHEIKLAKDAPALTLGDVAVNALETPLEEDRSLSGQDKFKLDELARRINKQAAVALTAEDVSTLKQRIGKAYGQLIVGIAYRLLDPVTATQ